MRFVFVVRIAIWANSSLFRQAILNCFTKMQDIRFVEFQKSKKFFFKSEK